MDASPTTAMRIASLEDDVAALKALVTTPAGDEAEPSRRPLLRIVACITACARVWNVPVETIQSVRRDRRYAWPRQAAMYLARELGHHSLLRIGRAFGRDHSTVLHAVRATAARRHANPDFAAMVQAAAALALTLSKEAPRP